MATLIWEGEPLARLLFSSSPPSILGEIFLAEDNFNNVAQESFYDMFQGWPGSRSLRHNSANNKFLLINYISLSLL